MEGFVKGEAVSQIGKGHSSAMLNYNQSKVYKKEAIAY